ncbi:MAG: L-lactate permease [Anaerolineae bacterium]|nr:L-lactate permease [Anaerolineae bacterium]MCO5196675.1 L-lactate permease [Anaerolineae bacterium]
MRQVILACKRIVHAQPGKAHGRFSAESVILPTMSLPPVNWGTILLALSPILLVLFLMIGLKWGGSKAGLAGWSLAILVSVLFFGAGIDLLVIAFGKSLLLSLFVLYLIWMALLLYNVVNDAGAIDVIGAELPRLAHTQPAQALLLAFVFGSFLQGATGFGVPAAVIAPLLVGVGFTPTTAVVVALLGHGWAVTFGSLGSSFISLMAATGLSGEQLAGNSAEYLFFCCLLCGIAVLWATAGKTALREQWLRLIVLTVVMGGTQWALAVAGFWNLAAFGAGLVGLTVAIIDFRYGIFEIGQSRKTYTGQTVNIRRLAIAFTPYFILIIVILVASFLLKEPLNAIQLNYEFPAVTTRFGWQTEAGPGRSISVFGHPGALLLYTSLLAFLWFRWRGTFVKRESADQPHYSFGPLVRKTIQGSRKSTVSIVALVAMAVTMQYAGMTQLLAEVFSANTGQFFLFLSPFIGALGAFMTGSNTNSNVVFGSLQMQTAGALGVSISVILAAQTAGGAIGSIFAPAKVVVGVSTVKDGDESAVLRQVTIYSLAILFILGIVTWFAA